MASAPAQAEFTPGILANDSYWSDGKAEFDIYDGQLMRAGELRHCEVLYILMRERIDPKTLARVDDLKRNDAINAVRMQQIWNAPLGLFGEQASLTALWKLDSLSLAQLNLSPAGFEIPLAPSITTKDEPRSFAPAKVSWKPRRKVSKSLCSKRPIQTAF